MLFIVRDNASSHTTAKLDDFLIRYKDRLRLVPMPTYSPHLNLIERLWHLMRDQINRSYFFESFPKLCQGVIEWLQRLPFSRFQSLMGIQTANLIHILNHNFIEMSSVFSKKTLWPNIRGRAFLPTLKGGETSCSLNLVI